VLDWLVEPSPQVTVTAGDGPYQTSMMRAKSLLPFLPLLIANIVVAWETVEDAGMYHGLHARHSHT